MHRPFLLWGEMERSSKPHVQFLATLLNMIREGNQTLNGAEILLKQMVVNILLPTEVVVVLITEQEETFFFSTLIFCHYLKLNFSFIFFFFFFNRMSMQVKPNI